MERVKCMGVGEKVSKAGTPYPTVDLLRNGKVATFANFTEHPFEAGQWYDAQFVQNGRYWNLDLPIMPADPPADAAQQETKADNHEHDRDERIAQAHQDNLRGDALKAAATALGPFFAAMSPLPGVTIIQEYLLDLAEGLVPFFQAKTANGPGALPETHRPEFAAARDDAPTAPPEAQLPPQPLKERLAPAAAAKVCPGHGVPYDQQDDRGAYHCIGTSTMKCRA